MSFLRLELVQTFFIGFERKAVSNGSLKVIKIKFETWVLFDVLNVGFDVFYFVGLKMGVLGFVELDFFMLKSVVLST